VGEFHADSAAAGDTFVGIPLCSGVANESRESCDRLPSNELMILFSLLMISSVAETDVHVCTTVT
jgi:hypothetical protein